MAIAVRTRTGPIRSHKPAVNLTLPLAGDRRAEVDDPLAKGLMGNRNAALGQELLDIAEAEREAGEGRSACWMTVPDGPQSAGIGVQFLS